MTTEQRIMMRLNAMQLRPTVEAKRIWTHGDGKAETRATLKEMGFRFDANREAWYWERKPPQQMHRANKRRAERYAGELTDPNTTK